MSEDRGIQETHTAIVNFNISLRDSKGEVGVARVLDALENFHQFVKSLGQFGLEVEWDYHVTQVPYIRPIPVSPHVAVAKDQIWEVGWGDTYPGVAALAHYAGVWHGGP